MIPPKANEVTGWRQALRLLLALRASPGLPLLFLLAIFLPLADMAFHPRRPATTLENRQLAAKPDFSWQQPLDYLKKYEAYFNDHFGFRPRLLRAHNRLLYRLFHAAPSEKVIIGRRGWLYLGRGAYFNNEIDYFRASKPFSLQELQKFKTVLEQRRAWLERRGIRYLFMLAPNKSTIYPEYMPAAYNRVHERSRMDQLLDFLSRHSDVEVLDLRPALLREKRRMRIYHKTDTHWNDLGGYHAYREMIRHLQRHFADIQPLSRGDITIRPVDGEGGDLAIMLALQQDLFRESRIQVRPKARFRARSAAPTPGFRPRAPWVRLTAVECAGGRIPAGVMVRDSFARQLHPFLSEHFQRIVYIWDWELRFFTQVIEREKPRIVIDQMAERSLLSILPENPGELAAAARRPDGGPSLNPR